MNEKGVTRQLQTVACSYAYIGVKRNLGLNDKIKNEQDACEAYRNYAVPGLLKWLTMVAEPPVQLPPWVTIHQMGSSKMAGKGEILFGRLYE